jgi:heme-degrading monooxygenase HmoA
MFARVTTYHADEDADRLLEGFKGTIGPLQLMEGFSHGYFMVDRNTGAAMSMTVWETEDALSASAESAAVRRWQRVEAGGASIVSVDNYEINLIAAAPGVEPAHRVAEPLEEPGEHML